MTKFVEISNDANRVMAPNTDFLPSEVIVIVLEPHKSMVAKALSDAGSLKMKIDLVGIPDADLGTADALRHKEVREK